MGSDPTAYAIRVPVGQATRRRHGKPRLGQLDIELTERCNNDCIHCCINLPANDRAAQAREMTTAQVKAILDQAVALGALQVRFTGGEPLLRADFEELYVYARRLGLKVLIFTNGRLITPHLADLLACMPPLVPIEITVYGMHPASYDAVSRVQGAFAQFRRGVRLLLERGVSLVVKGAVLPPNRHELAEMETWATTVVGMSKPPSHALFLDLRGRRDAPEKNARIRELRLSPAEGLEILTRDAQAYSKSMQEFCAKFMRAPGDTLFTCGAGISGCVDAYGRLQPCMMLRDPTLSVDLLTAEHTLEEALTGIFPKQREMRAANPDYLARCARCFLKGLCEQCPAKSWAEHGTLDTPVDYLCEIAHAQARYLGLLAEGESAWEVEDGPARVARMDR